MVQPVQAPRPVATAIDETIDLTDISESEKSASPAGSNDCGLFAAAYCTSLAHGQNPSAFVYDQSLMGKHLMCCLEAQKMDLFPCSNP